MTRQEWNDALAAWPEANFLQSWQWGALHETLGEKVIRSRVRKNDEPVGMWQGIVKNARRGRYLEVPGGPLIDWSDKTAVRLTTAQLKEVAAKERCVFVRIRPQVREDKRIYDSLRQAGFRRAPMHLHAEHTNILSLQSPDDELLAGMRQQTRYEVRRAGKQGVTVSEASSEKAIEEFFTMQQETAKRQGFVPSSLEFLKAEQHAFGNQLKIYRAEKDGTVLNMALVLWFGEEADYHEAASSPEARRLPGAYAIQWQAIRDAREAGKSRYNFWGIAYTDDPKHRYAGVTTFKRGFGGDDVAYVSAHDLVLRPGAYVKNWLVETARKKRRKL